MTDDEQLIESRRRSDQLNRNGNPTHTEDNGSFETTNGSWCCKFPEAHRQVLVGSTWGFLTNVERAIIMPSLWLYLKSTWQEDVAFQFYAVILAAFCLAILVFTPVVGYAAHKGMQTTAILLVSNICEVFGNVMYLVGHSPWILLFGRFLSGIGACCDVPLYSDMVRLTKPSERTSYVIAMLVPRQTGLLFGPAFNVLVHRLNLKIGELTLNVYNVPGLVMAVLWLFHCLLIILVYPSTNRTSGTTQPLTLSARVKRFFYISKLHETEPTDMSDQVDGSSKSTHVDSIKFTPCSPCIMKLAGCHPYILYWSCALFAMYGIIFMTYFTSLALEAVLPPVAQRLYGWSELEVSVVYLTSGGIIILLFLAYYCVKKCLTDLTILIVGMFCLLLAYTWLACYLAYRPSLPTNVGISLMMSGVFFHVLGTPMVATTCESIYTKLVPVSDVERGQTIFRTVLNVGYLCGPFVGGTLITVPYAAFLIMLCLVFVPFVILCLEYEKVRQCL